MSATAIKICGVTRLEDAELAVSLGAFAIGLNFWAGSKRRCSFEVAREIAARWGGRTRIVAVTVDASSSELASIRGQTGIEWVQLHGDEPDDLVRALLPHAYKAIRASGEAGLAIATQTPGIELLLDADVRGAKGGTGQLADWSLAARIARARPLWLAGGIRPDNAAEAIARVRPFGIDVASGTESAPGIKDPERMRALFEAVRAAG